MFPDAGKRQQQILGFLLEHRSGLTVDELASRIGITRTAVAQHLVALERDGYVARGDLLPTRGRPVRAYTLTETGLHLFPKQYSWFSALLLASLKADHGGDGLAAYLRRMAGSLATAMAGQFAGDSDEQRLFRLVEVLNGLAYQAFVEPAPDGGRPGVAATHCVYHDLVRQHPEVCEFDLELLSRLMGMDVTHVECIARGGDKCRFAFERKPFG